MTPQAQLAGAVADAEEWRPVLGYETSYEVSNQGRVRSISRNVSVGNGHTRRIKSRVVAVHRDHKGYLTTGIGKGRERKRIRVHTVVLNAFVGARPDGMVCRHLDDDKTNNALSNLCWGTPSENQFDIVRNGNNFAANRTHCPRGHAYDEANTRTYRGSRYCRTCRSPRLLRIVAAGGSIGPAPEPPDVPLFAIPTPKDPT